MVKKRRDARNSNEEKPTKQEKQIASHVRFNCPTKKAVVQGDEVHYFTGAKAVDCLMASKWSADKCSNKANALFANRAAATEFMQRILSKGMIWRARKLVAKLRNKDEEVKDKKKKKDKCDDKTATDKRDSPKKVGKTPASASTSTTETKEKHSDEKEEDDDEKSKKKKQRKVKLEFHSDQNFRDDKDVYVWHYDPISWTKFTIGLLLVFGAIVVCLFPLWPSWLRLGVYYLSLGAMGLIGLLFALVVLRSLIFAMVWMCSMGRHHFWLLPNLTEDCGFFESFKPLYSHSVAGDGKKDKDGGRHKKNDDDNVPKDSADEDDNVDVKVDDDNDQQHHSSGGDSDGGANGDAQENGDGGMNSDSVSNTDEVNESTAPSTPAGGAAARKRRPRRDDDGAGFEFVN